MATREVTPKEKIYALLCMALVWLRPRRLVRQWWPLAKSSELALPIVVLIWLRPRRFIRQWWPLAESLKLAQRRVALSACPTVVAFGRKLPILPVAQEGGHSCPPWALAEFPELALHCVALVWLRPRRFTRQWWPLAEILGTCPNPVLSVL